MKKRLTAMLLVVCMLFTLMPTAVFAVDGDPLTVSASNSDVEIVKSASRTSTPGVYDVTVSVNPKVDLTPKPTEIVLVLDISYSMQYCMEEKHEHTSSCVSCGQEEHTHGWGCYDWHDNLICGKTEHSHTEACYICGKTEHTHGWGCYD